MFCQCSVFIVSCIINVISKHKSRPHGLSLHAENECFFIIFPPRRVVDRAPRHCRSACLFNVVGFFPRKPHSPVQEDPQAKEQRQKPSHSTSHGNGPPCKMMPSCVTPNFKTACLRTHTSAPTLQFIINSTTDYFIKIYQQLLNSNVCL